MLKTVGIFLLGLVLVVVFVSGETIIVSDIVNDTTNTSTTNVTIITDADIQTLQAYTISLKNLTEQTLEEKEYLRALSTRYERDSQNFIIAMNASAEVALAAIESEQLTRQQMENLDGNYTIRLENLKVRIDDLERQNIEIKAKTALLVLITVIVTIFLTIFIYNFTKGKRAYFLIKWIREKIPIKF